jgi:hypothetical protein
MRRNGCPRHGPDAPHECKHSDGRCFLVMVGEACPGEGREPTIHAFVRLQHRQARMPGHDAETKDAEDGSLVYRTAKVYIPGGGAWTR